MDVTCGGRVDDKSLLCNYGWRSSDECEVEQSRWSIELWEEETLRQAPPEHLAWPVANPSYRPGIFPPEHIPDSR